jgi:hypothetical protein
MDYMKEAKKMIQEVRDGDIPHLNEESYLLDKAGWLKWFGEDNDQMEPEAVYVCYEHQERVRKVTEMQLASLLMDIENEEYKLSIRKAEADFGVPVCESVNWR